jgi:hypothetical protein
MTTDENEIADLEARIAALKAAEAPADDVAPVTEEAEPVDPTSAPAATWGVVGEAGTASTSIDPTLPVAASTLPSESPEVVPAHVLPTGLPSDSREVDAMKAAGTAPGLSNAASKAMADFDNAISAIKKWIVYAEDAARRVKSL